MVMNKEKCDCGNLAKWLYMPGYGDDSNPYSCDDCVVNENDKVGCSCNWHNAKDGDLPEGIEGKDWIWVEYTNDGDSITKQDEIWIRLNNKGRVSPCVEYDYSEDGFDIDENE